jgi:hypothetical protein
MGINLHPPAIDVTHSWSLANYAPAQPNEWGNPKAASIWPVDMPKLQASPMLISESGKHFPYDNS